MDNIYKIISNEISISIIITDLKFFVTYINKFAKNLFGIEIYNSNLIEKNAKLLKEKTIQINNIDYTINRIQRENQIVFIIKEKDKKEKSEKIKKFISTNSNEILNEIENVNNISIILKDMIEDQEKLDLLNKLILSNKKTNNLLMKITNFSKIDTNSLEVIFDSFNLRDFFEIETLNFCAENNINEVNFMFNISQKLNIEIYSDKKIIKQIYFEILKNSLKFTKKGSIKVEIRELKKSNSKVEFEIRISDTGIGIHKRKLLLINDLIKNNDENIYLNKIKGFGLYIVNELVKKLNGQINISSSLGFGTKVKITFGFEYIESNSGEDISLNNIAIFEKNHLKSLQLNKIMEDRSSSLFINNDETTFIDICKFNEFDYIFINDNLNNSKNIKDRLKKFNNETKIIYISNILDESGIKEIKKDSFDGVIFLPFTIIEFENLIQYLENNKNGFYYNEKLVNKKPFTKIRDIKNFKDRNVIIAEDNLANQIIIKKWLNNVGINVELVINGKQLLEKVQEKFYDLILLDLKMPDFDGYFFLESSLDLENKTDIVVMSANLTEKCIMKLYSYGINNFLEKPFKPNELIEIIEKVFKIRYINIKYHKDNKIIDKSTNREISIVNIEIILENVNYDKEFLHEMLDIFYEDINGRIKYFEEIMLEKNYKEIEFISHKLKGMLSIYGINGVAELLKYIENNSNEEKYEEIFKYFLIVKEKINLAIEFFKKWNYNE